LLGLREFYPVNHLLIFSPFGIGVVVCLFAARTLLLVATGMELMPFVIISCRKNASYYHLMWYVLPAYISGELVRFYSLRSN
jgi:hypothetical protein